MIHHSENQALASRELADSGHVLSDVSLRHLSGRIAGS